MDHADLDAELDRNELTALHNRLRSLRDWAEDRAQRGLRPAVHRRAHDRRPGRAAGVRDAAAAPFLTRPAARPLASTTDAAPPVSPRTAAHDPAGENPHGPAEPHP
jgi:hypothetical protein